MDQQTNSIDMDLFDFPLDSGLLSNSIAKSDPEYSSIIESSLFTNYHIRQLRADGIVSIRQFTQSDLKKIQACTNIRMNHLAIIVKHLSQYLLGAINFSIDNSTFTYNNDISIPG